MSTARTRACHVLQMCGVLVISLSSPCCYADHGGVGCAAVPQGPLSEPGALVAEPAQRVIILWNGTTERLILSTDVSLASDPYATNSLVEFIPLPERPIVSQGPVDIFGKLVTFASRVNVDLSALLPVNPVGSMSDNVDIEQIDRATTLVDRLNSRCEIQRSYVEPTIGIAQRYLDHGDHWFVIDKIAVGTALRSYPPIIYEFPAKQLFYPLDTSTMAIGDTGVDIVAITPNRISTFDALSTPIQIRSTFSVDKNDLAEASADWPAFFDQDTLVVQHWSLHGKLSDMHLDLFAR